MITEGDIVGRKSYNLDIIFEVSEIKDEQAILIGKTVRLIADAPLDDLEIVNNDKLEEEEAIEEELIRDITESSRFDYRKKFLTGKILHIDGDEKYMKKCLNVYKQLGIYAVGISAEEEDIPSIITKYVKYLSPDIVVITGHDSFNRKEQDEVGNYRNSRHYIDAVKMIRRSYPVSNQPIVIAGACQSHFEALIAAGANFASSPKRVNIHSLDPAIIAIKCSITPFNETVNVFDAVERTSNKYDGMGGIDSFGTLKTLHY
ncbi:sporulation peptidase YabG [Haloplasma contractile]|uniref:Sporulation-specific protease YabG protein n=1 Tax=Haloplasma contractile SSD-17B TaxID=1033810 RepID=U2ECH3_9MOLU|nr:sporulation peptidase YabG [Haloplasma contractile]ERJ12466.1 Sporulation-specific protease YabG protein [Haloplasma contractile SSD-17B]